MMLNKIITTGRTTSYENNVTNRYIIIKASIALHILAVIYHKVLKVTTPQIKVL